MSDQARENAQFRKEKSPILVKYQDEHAKLFSAVAGRGFLSLPGYAYDIENNLELATKFSLSDLNYKILAETVERSLKQAGLTYDLAFRNAQMAWEVSKQGLLDDWGAEYSLIKQEMAEEEEAVLRLGVALYIRQVYLIEQKTAIALQAEAYKNQIAGLGTAEATSEAELAAKKLLTAQKKLELIPFLEAILAQELLLIAALQGKNGYDTELMTALRAIADKKSHELLPAMADLIAKLVEYEDELIAQKELELRIATEKYNIALQEYTSTVKRVDISAKKELLSAAELVVEKLKIELSDLQRKSKSSILQNEITQWGTWLASELSSEKLIIATEKADDTGYGISKSVAISMEGMNKITSTQASNAAEVRKIVAITNTRAGTTREEATIRAAAHIVSELTHVLSQ